MEGLWDNAIRLLQTGWELGLRQICSIVGIPAQNPGTLLAASGSDGAFIEACRAPAPKIKISGLDHAGKLAFGLGDSHFTTDSAQSAGFAAMRASWVGWQGS